MLSFLVLKAFFTILLFLSLPQSLHLFVFFLLHSRSFSLSHALNVVSSLAGSALQFKGTTGEKERFIHSLYLDLWDTLGEDPCIQWHQEKTCPFIQSVCVCVWITAANGEYRDRQSRDNKEGDLNLLFERHLNYLWQVS